MNCTHTNQINNDVKPMSEGCEECIKNGDSWVEIRECLVCGHIGCCDSSVGKHATKHFHETNHAVMQSYKSPRNFKWCYIDEVMIED